MEGGLYLEAGVRRWRALRGSDMRYLGYLVGLLWASSLWAGSTGGYLSAVGPAPLRFQPPPKVVASPNPLPPLPVPQPIGEMTFEVPPMTLGPRSTGEIVSTRPDAVVSASSTTRESSTETAVAVPAPEAGVVTPQVLVDLFHSTSGCATNQAAAVVMPIGFMPPVPQPPPSSSATYISQ